jgi:hypothetical protein
LQDGGGGLVVEGAVALEEGAHDGLVEDGVVELLGEEVDDGAVSVLAERGVLLGEGAGRGLEKTLLSPLLREVLEPVGGGGWCGAWSWRRVLGLGLRAAVSLHLEGADTLDEGTLVPGLDLVELLGVVAQLDALLGEVRADLVAGAEEAEQAALVGAARSKARPLATTGNALRENRRVSPANRP